MQCQLKRAEDVDTASSSSGLGAITSKKVRSLRSRLGSGANPIRYKSMLDVIYARLDGFYEQKARLSLVVGATTEETRQRTPATSVSFHKEIYGREDVEKQITDLLGIGGGQGSSGATKFDVIAIVGMGGIGKTSLARHVFNDAAVQNHFELKGWVCVSSQFDVKWATKTILEKFEVDGREVAELDLNVLQTKLEDKLVKEKKKFLLVLDGVRFNFNDWDNLRGPFRAAAAGSKIIVTTRDKAVASMMVAVRSFILPELSDAACLSVLRQHAFDNDPSASFPPPFQKKILEKCKGLPLAASVLGGLLRGRQPNDWEFTLNNDIWALSEAEDGIQSTLRLSYHHLSDPVKRCFSYCSVLPKNYEFEEEEIVLLWMAEGLIDEEDMEDLGRQYFRELLSRSLFQYANHEKSRFVMHNLVNDLARFAAGKSYVNLEDDLSSSFENARYASYSYFKSSSSSRGGNLIFEKCRNMKSLRLLIIWNRSSLDKSSLNLLPKLSYLRTLTLRCCDVRELPKDIGKKLMHLRYIDLSGTYIERLPESICSIWYLQTLKLKDCGRLMTLPVDMRKLKSLRHLDLSGCDSLQSIPDGLDELTCLRTISICVQESLPVPPRELRIHNCKKLEVLKIRFWQSVTRLTSEDMALPASLTKLKIEECENLEFVAAGWPADSCLRELNIIGCSSLTRLTSEDMALPASLTKLEIWHCKNLEFVAAPWPADSCLQELEIHECSSLTRLTSGDMALPASLTKLKIWNCKNLKFVAARWPDDSCLQELKMSGCSSVTRLTSQDMALPASLTKLVIRNCEKLESVAASWPALQELEIIGCSSLTRLTSEGMALPASLTKLKIQNCNKLEFVAESWPADSSLKELEIRECSSLIRLGIFSGRPQMV